MAGVEDFSEKDFGRFTPMARAIDKTHVGNIEDDVGAGLLPRLTQISPKAEEGGSAGMGISGGSLYL